MVVFAAPGVSLQEELARSCRNNQIRHTTIQAVFGSGRLPAAIAWTSASSRAVRLDPFAKVDWSTQDVWEAWLGHERLARRHTKCECGSRESPRDVAAPLIVIVMLAVSRSF